jgi:prolyl oligopeptidase
MMNRLLSLNIIIFLSLFSLGCQQRQSTASKQLKKLFEEEWEFTLREYPITATFYGDHRYDDKLPDVSLDAIQKRNHQYQDYLERLRKIDQDALSSEERLNYDIYQRLTQMELAEFEFRTYLMPLTNRSGFHVTFPQLPDRVPLRTIKDYENYIARLLAFGDYARGHIDLLKEGIRQGYVVPRVILNGIGDVVQPHIVNNAEESLLFQPFQKFPKQFTDSDKQRFRLEGEQVIMSTIVSSYREFIEFVVGEYLPKTRKNIAASELPNGKEFYRHRIRYYTSIDMDPEEVHHLGKDEVKRIKSDMKAIIEKVGFSGNFRSFIQFLRNDKRFYVSKSDQLMKEVAYVLKKMDGELPKLFKTLPRTPYGIRRIPDFIAPKTTTAYYEGPAGDGSRAGFYAVNTYDLKSRPLYEVEALSLHEAVPGHHLQIALQQELKNLPDFRRFGGFTAFTEGWALYAERLGLEVGFYQDPYSNFGRLTYEMWRACRLVVDTGIHYLGWSRQQAIDYMAENSALSLHNITTEVDRYIAWPGQALAYKIGELKIRELREFAEKRLGGRFDVREFHDRILENGALPLDLLENHIKVWINKSEIQ